MIANKETLLYIARTVGKPIVAVYNDIEERWYFYLVDTFTQANPSNHIHDNYIHGKNIATLLTSLSGHAHGTDSTSVTGILTKIEEIPLEKLTFNNFKWIKLQA